MRKLSKLAAIFAAFILACAFIGCDNPSNNSSSSYNMHYFFTDYGTNSAMIRTADNSDVAILSTTESGKRWRFIWWYFCYTYKNCKR